MSGTAEGSKSAPTTVSSSGHGSGDDGLSSAASDNKNDTDDSASAHPLSSVFDDGEGTNK